MASNGKDPVVVGVDTGGTFTDLILVDTATERWRPRGLASPFECTWVRKAYR